MSDVKFAHYREVGMQRQKDGTYRKGFTPRGGMTVAFVTGETGTTFAVAQCSPNDNFRRSTGRNIAEHRLTVPRYARVTEHTSVKDFVSFLDAWVDEDFLLVRNLNY